MDKEEISFKGKLFGKEIEIVMYSVDKKKASKVFWEVYKEALRLEKIFNFYDKDSELSKLNEKRKMKVSQELAEVLSKALVFCEMTRGEYDITLGKVIRNRKEGKKDIDVACSYKDIKIDRNKVSLNHRDVILDMGSIAKGFITDRIGDLLKNKGVNNFLIDSRGDMLILGGAKQEISIQHPRDKDKILGSVTISNEAIATSGDYNQFYESYKKSHILNSKEIISVSVIASSLEEADVYASALFVSDEKTREKIIEENPHTKAIIVTKDLKQHLIDKYGELVYETKL